MAAAFSEVLATLGSLPGIGFGLPSSDSPHLDVVDYPDVSARRGRRRRAAALGPLVGRGHHLLREVQEELLDAAVLLGRGVEVPRAHRPRVPEKWCE